MPERLTECLIRRRLLDPARAREAIERQVLLGGALDTCLLELRMVSEPALVDAIAAAYGLPTATTRQVTSPVDERVCRAFPEQWAKKHGLAPLTFEPETRTLTVLSPAPADLTLLSRLGELLDVTLLPLLTPEYRVHQRLALLYGDPPEERFRALMEARVDSPAASTSSPGLDSPLVSAGVARLREAQDRDEIVQIALEYAHAELELAAIFIVHERRLEGFAAMGLGAENVGSSWLPLNVDSAFRRVLHTQTHHFGPLPDDTVHGDLLARLGRSAPRSALILPVRIRSRTVALLYGENGPRPISPRLAADLISLSTHIQAALEGLLVRRKTSTSRFPSATTDLPVTTEPEAAPNNAAQRPVDPWSITSDEHGTVSEPAFEQPHAAAEQPAPAQEHAAQQDPFREHTVHPDLAYDSFGERMYDPQPAEQLVGSSESVGVAEEVVTGGAPQFAQMAEAELPFGVRPTLEQQVAALEHQVAALAQQYVTQEGQVLDAIEASSSVETDHEHASMQSDEVGLAGLFVPRERSASPDPSEVTEAQPTESQYVSDEARAIAAAQLSEGQYVTDEAQYLATAQPADGPYVTDESQYGAAAHPSDGHYVTDEGSYVAAAQPSEGQYVTDEGSHVAAAQPSEGPYVTDAGSYVAAAQPREGQYVTDEGLYVAAAQRTEAPYTGEAQWSADARTDGASGAPAFEGPHTAGATGEPTHASADPEPTAAEQSLASAHVLAQELTATADAPYMGSGRFAIPTAATPPLEPGRWGWSETRSRVGQYSLIGGQVADEQGSGQYNTVDASTVLEERLINEELQASGPTAPSTPSAPFFPAEPHPNPNSDLRSGSGEWRAVVFEHHASPEASAEPTSSEHLPSPEPSSPASDEDEWKSIAEELGADSSTESTHADPDPRMSAPAARHEPEPEIDAESEASFASLLDTGSLKPTARINDGIGRGEQGETIIDASSSIETESRVGEQDSPSAQIAAQSEQAEEDDGGGWAPLQVVDMVEPPRQEPSFVNAMFAGGASGTFDELGRILSRKAPEAGETASREDNESDDDPSLRTHPREPHGANGKPSDTWESVEVTSWEDWANGRTRTPAPETVPQRPALADVESSAAAEENGGDWLPVSEVLEPEHTRPSSPADEPVPLTRPTAPPPRSISTSGLPPTATHVNDGIQQRMRTISGRHTPSPIEPFPFPVPSPGPAPDEGSDAFLLSPDASDSPPIPKPDGVIFADVPGRGSAISEDLMLAESPQPPERSSSSLPAFGAPVLVGRPIPAPYATIPDQVPTTPQRSGAVAWPRPIESPLQRQAEAPAAPPEPAASVETAGLDADHALQLEFEIRGLLSNLESHDRVTRRRAREALMAYGPYVLPMLMERYPGVLNLDPFSSKTSVLPPFGECGDLLAVLASFGADAHPHVMRKLDGPDPLQRLFATHFYGAIFAPEVIPRLVQRLHDEEPRISMLAARTLFGYRDAPEFQTVLEHLHGRLKATSLAARRHAAQLLGVFHDVTAIPFLIDVLERKERALFEAAESALVEITRQRFGSNAKKWRAWWTKNQGRPRIGWLIDGLSAKEAEIRRGCAEELRTITGIDLGYDEDAPRKNREDARLRWVRWFNEQHRLHKGQPNGNPARS